MIGTRERTGRCHVERARRGLTLLEILVALGIFFASMAMLSQVSWNGTRAAVQARLRSQAILRCEAKLAEVVSGVETLQPRTNVPFPDDSKWTWSLSISDTTYPDLLQLDVTVAHTGNSSLANVSFTLRRWMRDPALFQDAALQQEAQSQ